MTDLQERIDQIVARYQPDIDAIIEEGKQFQDGFDEPTAFGGMVGIDFEVSWEKTDFSFDLPEITMKRHDISFDLPQVSMNTKKVIFDTPSVRMETRVVGRYPEFRGFPPKVSWSDIKIDVPVPFMERQEISFDIPEVKMERTEISFDIPEFRMRRFEWSLHLPQFKIINVKADIQMAAEFSAKLKEKGERLSQAMQAEIQTVLGGGSAEGTQAIIDQRAAISAPFDAAVQKIDAAITELTAKNIDPIKVPAEGGNINLRQTLLDVVTAREKVLADFDSNVTMTP